MSAELASLPPELVRCVMAHLPVPALFALGQTCHYMRAVQLGALGTLQLGVFPSRLDGIFSNLDGCATFDAARNVAVVLPPHEAHSQDGVIRQQNRRIAGVLRQAAHRAALRDVELALWELDKGTARALGQLGRLRSLAVRLDHPHSKHPKVDRAFWRQSPGSTVWNELYAPSRPRRRRGGPDGSTSRRSPAGSRSASPASSASSSGSDDDDDAAAGEAEDGATPRPVLGQLQRLTLERAGITDYQLRRILEDNPGLAELRLRRCRTLTAETFEYLAASPAGRRLRVLHFEHSDAPDVDARVLAGLAALPALRELSLRGCSNLTNAEVRAARAAWPGVRDLVLPMPEVQDVRARIAVDPAYK